jgi:hypothetical protein
MSSVKKKGTPPPKKGTPPPSGKKIDPGYGIYNSNQLKDYQKRMFDKMKPQLDSINTKLKNDYYLRSIEGIDSKKYLDAIKKDTTSSSKLKKGGIVKTKKKK